MTKGLLRTSPHRKVLVILLLHGDPPRITDTIQSIKNQTCYKCEVDILCLDDGSSPVARKKLRHFGVSTEDLSPNCSIAQAKNYAIMKSNAELICLVDDHMVLQDGSLSAALELFETYPNVAGICGYYRCSTPEDYNILRDLKRESIYGKNNTELFITPENFTTFSTGLCIVRRQVFLNFDFPQNLFPSNCGGEDIPALLTALYEGHLFMYSPRIRALHDHNLTLSACIAKMLVEVRGRFSILHWAMKHPEITIPYVHGFLNFPYFLAISAVVALTLTTWLPLLWIATLPFLLKEVSCSMKTLTAPMKVPLSLKVKAGLYVFLSDILSVLLFPFYFFSNGGFLRHTSVMSCIARLNNIYLRWEAKKWGLR